jgi:hypothetical protein
VQAEGSEQKWPIGRTPSRECEGAKSRGSDPTMAIRAEGAEPREPEPRTSEPTGPI